MTKARLIAYYYNTTLAQDETVLDPDGEIPIPSKDEVLTRKARPWKVSLVSADVSTIAKGPIPVHKIYLTEA